MDIVSMAIGSLITVGISYVGRFLLGNKTKDDYMTKEDCEMCDAKKLAAEVTVIKTVVLRMAIHLDVPVADFEKLVGNKP